MAASAGHADDKTGPARAVSQGAETAARSKRSSVLTKAALRASDRLGLTKTELAKVLGISASTASRMSSGAWAIAEQTKQWELAALLVRVFRSLDALVGGSERHAKEWLRADNIHLSGSPAKLIFKVEGLTNVARYLDALRGAQ